jgi:hypothetical protein
MANPTTNFGWVMPTSTDLVTDLPADFAVFGQGVDTSFADLNGGTTGQVLSKASNTNLDFAWVSDASGMANPMTTTGDMIYSSPGSTPVRLGVGTTGQILTVAAGVPAWAAPAGGGKVLQVIAATYSTQVNSTSSTFADTNLTATITPSSASSKVLVLVNHGGTGKDSGNANSEVGLQLLRGATQIVLHTGIGYTNTTNFNAVGSAALFCLDTPATTSATTYKTQIRNPANSGIVFVGSGSSTSTIILMEIGA